MDSSTRNDILASNLLYASVALLILYQVAGWISQGLALPTNHFSPMHFTLPTVGALVLSSLVRVGLAYAVRRGVLAAKLLLALGFVVLLYNGTYWEKGVVAGVNFTHFGVDSLVLLLSSLLTLAALVLMFWPTRDSAPIV